MTLTNRTLPKDRGNAKQFPNFAHLLRLSYADRDSLPVIPAVYIIHVGDLVLYIGQSIALRNRVKGHNSWLAGRLKSLRKHISIAWMPTKHEHLLATERHLIQQMRPVFNLAQGLERLVDLPYSTLKEAVKSQLEKGN